ncbi:MAG: ABC transporter permease [Chloroflexi bacterium]|nr:ABC transporter permease [Chloroflexota bacterium]
MELIICFDPEVMEIAARTLGIAGTSCLLASLISLPLASLIHFRQFRGKRVLVNIIQTLFSVPTVIVGLFVFVLLSRAGPLGELGILFTPAAMVIGQMILITPILLGLTISALSGVSKEVVETATSLGASGSQLVLLVLREARYAVLAALILGFGRAISELGVAMMIGGNIRGFTRVMTTAISLATTRGELEMALALGIILLFLALVINIVLNRLQQR